MRSTEELCQHVRLPIPITSVEGFTDVCFPPVPPLEHNLTTFFGMKSGQAVAAQRAALAFSSGQQLVRLADKSHQSSSSPSL